MDEIMAIMKNVRFGCDDEGHPALMFTVYVSEMTAADQVLHGVNALTVIEDSGVSDVRLLEGKPCWVRREGNLIRFERLCKIP